VSYETDTLLGVDYRAENLPWNVWVCEERGEGDKILPLTGALEIKDAC
jgi:hypothetical protein